MEYDQTNRLSLLLIFLVTVTGVMGNTLISASIPDILNEFGKEKGDAGLIIAAATFPGILMALVVGILADRYGRRNVLVPSLILFGIGGTLAAFAPSFIILLVCRLIQGFGSAGLINLAIVMIGDAWEGDQRANYIAYNSAILTIAITIFPSIGGLLAQFGGWRLSFAPYPLSFLTALLIYKWLPISETPPVQVEVRSQLFETLRKPVVFGSIACGTTVFALVFGVFITSMPALLKDSMGFGPFARGIIISLPSVTSTLAAFTVVRVKTMIGVLNLLMLATLFLIIGFFFIATRLNIYIIAIGVLFYGLGEGSIIPTCCSLSC